MEHLKAACPKHQRLWVWAWSALPRLGRWWEAPLGVPVTVPLAPLYILLTSKYIQLCLTASLPSMYTFRTQHCGHSIEHPAYNMGDSSMES